MAHQKQEQTRWHMGAYRDALAAGSLVEDNTERGPAKTPCHHKKNVKPASTSTMQYAIFFLQLHSLPVATVATVCSRTRFDTSDTHQTTHLRHLQKDRLEHAHLQVYIHATLELRSCLQRALHNEIKFQARTSTLFHQAFERTA